MINLHKSIGPVRDRTREPWICSQTRICCQTRYRLRCAVRYIKVNSNDLAMCRFTDVLSLTPTKRSLHTVETRMKCRILRHFISVYTVCLGKKKIFRRKMQYLLKIIIYGTPKYMYVHWIILNLLYRTKTVAAEV